MAERVGAWALTLLGMAALIGIRPAPVWAQFQADRYTLTADERKQLAAGRDHLGQVFAALRQKSVQTGVPRADQLPDVEIYFDAVDRNLAQNLFFTRGQVAQAQACLTEGETRAAQLAMGKSPWEQQTGTVVLGYRSQTDGSAQPYQVYVPAGYNFTARKPMRLDIFLHGRGGNLNELTFLRSTGWVKGEFGPTPPDFLAIQPYGRANNGWRFAGETDIFEALADCRRRYPVDPDRVMLRGFSMGGHGVWHVGLQHPGDWAAISPGAGFVDTIQYQKMTKPLPDWQAPLLHLYDALDYAANAKDVPLFSYVGELDPVLSQHKLMDAALQKEHAPYKEFIGPKTPHRYEPEALKAILTDMAACRRNPESASIDFVTYTLRFPECKWVRIEGLAHHWERSEVKATINDTDRVVVTTHNITALRLTPPHKSSGALQLRVDGQSVRLPASGIGETLSLIRRHGRWQLGEETGLHKRPGLQGPIDDALFGPLVAVSGTGTPWSVDAGKWAGLAQQRFREEWSNYFRGTLPEKTDVTLTDEDIRNKNLYLFGDPGSNAVLRRLLPHLPFSWTPREIRVADAVFSANNHLPLLIYPNPESPDHYIVLNIGLTFSRMDQNSSNSLQFPHLPDYAVIHIDPNDFNEDRNKDVDLAGFFNENWQIPHP